MKRLIVNLVALLVIGMGGLLLSSSYAFANALMKKKNTETAGSCTQLWNNCVATAIQDYDNGTDDFDTFYLFYETICPGAYDNCIRNQ